MKLPGRMWCYFFGMKNGEEVKFGITENLRTRKQHHETINGKKEYLDDLAFVLATKPDELRILNLLSQYTSRSNSKEWFHATLCGEGKYVRDYIRWLRSQPYVAPTIDEAEKLTENIDSSYWMPKPENTKNFYGLPIVTNNVWDDLYDEVMKADYYTPANIIETVRLVMGKIDLDPASCYDANKVIKASKIYGLKDNGLICHWAGRVWCNPPFGDWDLWVEKTLEEIDTGSVTEMCVLGPTRTLSNKGVFPLWRKFQVMWISYGRFKFGGPHAGTANDGHYIAYYGPNVKKFYEEFGKLEGILFPVYNHISPFLNW
jgi:hypothetical protein